MVKKSKSIIKNSNKVLRKKSGVNKELHQLAHYAFFAGIVIAILAGGWLNLIMTGECIGSSVMNAQALMTTLVIIGIIVGFFNLTAKETTPFLIAATALMLAGIVNLGLIPIFGSCLRQSLTNIVVFVVPGAIIVSMKAIWKLASD